MIHQRSASVGPLSVQRPTVHLEHPPSVPRSSVDAFDSFGRPLSPSRPPASFTRSASSRSTDAITPSKRPASGHSWRQSSSDSISSVTTASTPSHAHPPSSSSMKMRPKRKTSSRSSTRRQHAHVTCQTKKSGPSCVLLAPTTSAKVSPAFCSTATVPLHSSSKAPHM